MIYKYHELGLLALVKKFNLGVEFCYFRGKIRKAVSTRK